MLPASRLLRGFALAVAIPALLLGVASLPIRPQRPEQPPRARAAACADGPLSAGAADAPIELPADAPIAGFARLSWRSDGTRDPVSARALVLQAPGCRVAVVSAEILLVPDVLEAAVRARVQDLGLNGLVLAATHTHAGPGGYWRNTAFELGGTAPYDPRVEDAVVTGIAESIRRAAAAVGPADLSVARGHADALVWNRDGGGREGRLTAVRISRPRGEPVAELAVFAAHPTTLGKSNRAISGDWVSRFLRDGQRGVRLFLQGAVGDQSAALPAGPSTPEAYGDAVARAVDGLRFERVRPALALATAEVTLPAPSPGAVPALLRSAAGNLAYEILPGLARVSALRLGPVLLALVPAEPVAEVADAWRAEAGADVEIVSLAGGYVGYVETPEQIEARRGEAARTYYGPELAARLARGIVAAVEAVRQRPEP
jgi:Neutral/alkaline non-lysosomal ceramidase, N-terminal